MTLAKDESVARWIIRRCYSHHSAIQRDQQIDDGQRGADMPDPSAVSFFKNKSSYRLRCQWSREVYVRRHDNTVERC